MEKITVLLPGGFKPPHMGHLGLANKFATNPNVNKVIVMVGPTERDGINRQQSLIVWNLLPTHPKVEIVGVNEDNPMNAAFNYVFNLPKESKETVALGASAKSPEDAKRSQIFVAAINRYKTKPTKDGKTAPSGVKAVNMTDDVPSNYVGRSDDKNGKSISASVLRQDLSNNDFKNFSTNYPGVKTGIIKSIYNILKRSNPSVKKNLKERIKNIIINILNEQDDIESSQDVKDANKEKQTAEERNARTTVQWRDKQKSVTLEKEKALRSKIVDLKDKISDIQDEIRAIKSNPKSDPNAIKNKELEVSKTKSEIEKSEKQMNVIKQQKSTDINFANSARNALKAILKQRQSLK